MAIVLVLRYCSFCLEFNSNYPSKRIKSIFAHQQIVTTSGIQQDSQALRDHSVKRGSGESAAHRN